VPRWDVGTNPTARLVQEGAGEVGTAARRRCWIAPAIASMMRNPASGMPNSGMTQAMATMTGTPTTIAQAGTRCQAPQATGGAPTKAFRPARRSSHHRPDDPRAFRRDTQLECR